MLTVDLEQGSREWLEFRLTRIGASEIPIILGLSDKCTPLTLWKRKLGFVPDQGQHFGMVLGHRMEKTMRAHINKELDRDYQPVVVQHTLYDWAIASLDGYDEETNTCLEVKLVSKSVFDNLENESPEPFLAQAQWQLFCSDATHCLLAINHLQGSPSDAKSYIIQRNNEYIDMCFEKAQDFHYLLLHMIEPEMTEDDYTEITDDDFGLIANEWKIIKQQQNSINAREKELREKMIEYTDDGNCQGFGVRLSRVNREGSVDWKVLFDDLEGTHPDVAEKFNPDDYRKKQIGYWKLVEYSYDN